MEAPEKPRISRHRNPVDTSPYLRDARDKQREESEERRHFLYFTFDKPPERDVVGPLEMYVRSLGEASAQKPRWHKIVEHANSLANERGVSREQFYSTALIQFIEKLENARITNELNEAYKNIDQEEDVAFLNRLVRYYDPRLADE